MAKIQALIDIFSVNTYRARYAAAKATNTCIICGKPVDVFSNASTRLEYKISGLCQCCQKEYLGGKGSSYHK